MQAANVIITTPEKWDGISRSWQTRSYVKQVGLIIIDEIHLLGTLTDPCHSVDHSLHNIEHLYNEADEDSSNSLYSTMLWNLNICIVTVHFFFSLDIHHCIFLYTGPDN